jgi:hypothetical protein
VSKVREITIFGKNFGMVSDSQVSDLRTLERESAIYSDHWIDAIGDFRHVRIQFTPDEVKEYVRSMYSIELWLRAGKPTPVSEVKGIPEDIARRADKYEMVTRDGKLLNRGTARLRSTARNLNVSSAQMIASKYSSRVAGAPSFSPLRALLTR